MPSIPEALSSALKHLQAGRLETAELIGRQIVRQDPFHADAWHLLGLVTSRQGRNDLAAGCLQRAVELKPQAAAFQHNMGLVLQSLRRLDEAAACYRRALELQPDYAEALSRLGAVLKDQGQLDEAIASFRRVLALRPADAGTHCDLGLALKEQGQLDDAVACYHRALALDPNLAEAHNNLANILLDQGQADAAIVSYRRAAQLRPSSAEMHRNLGLALQDQGHWDEAIACFRHVLERQPDDVRTLKNLGMLFEKQGQLDQATACYRRTLKLEPDDAETYKNLGFALESQGNWDEAMACYRRMLDLKPDRAGGKVHHSLGLEYLAKGQLAKAFEVWRHWLTTDPSDPIARHMVAAATEQDVPARASDDYVRGTFDAFAPTFDQQLQKLDYRAPAMILTAVAEALGKPAGDLDVLDAGCGTGLCGPLLRPFARQLTGVDLSPGMLERADARQTYDRLIAGELTAHLRSAGDGYDLIVSADTLVYFGDLQPVLAAAASALRSDALLVFSLEEHPDDDAAHRGYRLQYHGRYGHTADYVRRTLAEAGLRVREMTFATLRTELGRPVAGMVVSACKDADW